MKTRIKAALQQCGVVDTIALCGVALLIVMIVFLVVAALLVWSLNSLAEAGGATFYIEHNLGNYCVALVLLLLVRGG